MEDVVLCPCQGVGAAAVTAAIGSHGLRTCDQVKKLTGAGMGPCQGRVCGPLLRAALLAGGISGEISPLRARPPLRLVPLAALAAGADALPQPKGTVSARVLWGLSEGGATLTLEAELGPEPGPEPRPEPRPEPDPESGPEPGA